MRHLNKLLAISILMITYACNAWSQNTLDADNLYNELMSGDYVRVSSALKTIINNQILDERILEYSDNQIKSGYNQNLDDGEHIELLSLHSKVLGNTGDEKYRESILLIHHAGHVKLKKYGRFSLIELNRMQRWNKFSALSGSEKRKLYGDNLEYVSLILSPDDQKVLEGLDKFDSDQKYDETMLDFLAKEVLLRSNTSYGGTHVKIVQNMVSIFRNAENRKYIDTLRKIPNYPGFDSWRKRIEITVQRILKGSSSK